MIAAGILSGLGLLILLFFLITNLTVKVAVLIDGKIHQYTKKRWIIRVLEENKHITVNFTIAKAHQNKIAGVVIKKGLAKKMRQGHVTVKVNHQKLHTFDIPKEIDQRFSESKRLS